LLSLIFESLDVQVTSLLGGLVFQSLVLEHLCAFLFFKGFGDIKFFAFIF
jgi:hypothetical protein